ncbi:MAG: hypothetical protein ACLQKY_04465 [Terracidiphilus sp.]
MGVGDGNLDRLEDGAVRGIWYLLIAGAVLVLGRVPVEGQKTTPHREQTDFSAEDEGVKQSVSIPDSVLAILRQDKFVRDVLENENVAPDKLPASWLSAAEVQLGGLGEKDLIVEGEGPLRGANVITFWVFVRNSQEYVLALTIPAHDLIVKKSRFNDYRNIETLGATAVTVTTVFFRFDGHRYRQHAARTEDIK